VFPSSKVGPEKNFIEKNLIVTNSKLFFWWADANFLLWSQNKKFAKVFGDFSKMDIKNVQKRKAENTFGKIFSFFYKSLKKKY